MSRHVEGRRAHRVSGKGQEPAPSAQGVRGLDVQGGDRSQRTSQAITSSGAVLFLCSLIVP